jgi:RNA polymerase-binding transcription factor DksA
VTTARRTAAVLAADQLAALRAALLEQRRFRVEQLAELQESIELPEPATDEITDRLRVGARFALGQIEAALDRMDTGRYGTCTRCSEEIPLERLEILPMSPLCVACSRQRQGQPGRPA